MAHDTRRLLAGLEAYQGALTQQKTTFREEIDGLRNAWLALSEVYAGTAAEEFSAAWTRTTAQLEDYVRTVESLEPVLRRRVEALREADRASGTLG